MTLSNYLEGAFLDHLTDNATLTPPADIYAKLHTGDPGEAGTNNASAETTRKVVAFGAASSGVATSTGTISWTTWAAGSETISYVSLWDNSTAGNCLGSGALAASKSVANGDQLDLTVITITLD